MKTRIGAARYLTLAVLLMAWGQTGLAAVQIQENRVAGTLYLINVWGAGSSDGWTERESNATALSPDGEVVGYALSGTLTIGFKGASDIVQDGVVRADVIRRTDLSFLRPLGVNENGTTVGDASPAASGSPALAFKKESPGAVTTIAGTSIGSGINASGQIVGQDSQGRAFLYSNSVQGAQPLTNATSAARAINNSGTIVGWREVSGQSQAFIYDGTMHNLLPSVTAASQASAINVQGDVAGTITARNGNGGGNGNEDSQAFLLRAGASAPEALGIVAGFDDSFANGISAGRWVVGDATRNGQNPETAWLWIDGQLFDLSSQLDWAWVKEVSPGTPGSQGSSGWIRLLGASAVGDNGLIVGEGWYQRRFESKWVQERRAFVLNVDVNSIPAIPEPGIYLMLFSGLIVIGAMRLRRLGPR